VECGRTSHPSHRWSTSPQCPAPSPATGHCACAPPRSHAETSWSLLGPLSHRPDRREVELSEEALAQDPTAQDDPELVRLTVERLNAIHRDERVPVHQVAHSPGAVSHAHPPRHRWVEELNSGSRAEVGDLVDTTHADRVTGLDHGR